MFYNKYYLFENIDSGKSVGGERSLTSKQRFESESKFEKIIIMSMKNEPQGKVEVLIRLFHNEWQ